MPTEHTDEEIISAGPYGCVYVLASDYAALDEAINECIKDRDWFSDRLDAATAELARVKAESLRVVPVGEAVLYGEIQDGILFGSEGEVACKNGQRSQYSGEADSWHFSREYKSGVVPITMFSRTAIVQPVRFERWEDEG